MSGFGDLGDHDETVARPGPIGSAASTGSLPPAASSAGPPARPAPAPGARDRRILAATAVLSALVLLGILAATLLPGLDRGRDQAAGAPDPEASTDLYVSGNFVIPFQLSAPTWVAPEPAVEKAQLVTWQTPEVAIRVMVPVEVYPPGDRTPSLPPRNYVTYLLNQSDAGARFSDSSLTTVGGQPATLVTATATRRLAGALGCPEAGLAQRRCYGLRPERRLRIAVVEMGDRTLLIWSRSDRKSRFEEERLLFEQTLSTVEFR